MTAEVFCSFLKTAAEHASSWSLEQARSMAKSIAASIAGAVCDWDEGAGEKWARVIADGVVVGLVFIDLPVVFIRQEVLDRLDLLLGPEVLAVPDFESRDYCIDGETRSALGIELARSQFDSASFSIQDLWWATV